MEASNVASCVRAGASWGAAAREARSEFRLLRGPRGFVMRLSDMITQHGYIRPRYRDATGVDREGSLPGRALCRRAQYSARGVPLTKKILDGCGRLLRRLWTTSRRRTSWGAAAKCR